jgi:hypothetical protein
MPSHWHLIHAFFPARAFVIYYPIFRNKALIKFILKLTGYYVKMKLGILEIVVAAYGDSHNLTSELNGEVCSFENIWSLE